LVAAWYVRAGYTIIARNWRCPRGELDVVAWRRGVLVVCEVKARRSTNFGNHPSKNATPASRDCCIRGCPPKPAVARWPNSV
jgi:Holliday junction resolvase-like predicted endonuclease